MKTLVAVAIMFATAASAAASAETVRATVKDHYMWQDVDTPITQTYCREGSAGGGALGGMIIGGLIGKGIAGNDKGAAVGAILGGVIGADKSGRKCWEETTYFTQSTQVYSHSTITFKQDGRTYAFDFYK